MKEKLCPITAATICPQTIRGSHFGPSRQELLQEIALQAEVLQHISHLLLEKKSISSTDSLLKFFFVTKKNRVRGVSTH